MPLDLLGGHVRHRADARPIGSLQICGVGGAHNSLGELGHAEVDDLRVAVAADHDVCRLDVAMNDAGVVRHGNPVCHLRHHLRCAARVPV